MEIENWIEVVREIAKAREELERGTFKSVLVDLPEDQDIHNRLKSHFNVKKEYHKSGKFKGYKISLK